MYVCICNPFTDKDVQKHLDTDTPHQRTKIKDVYKSCSGGEEMNCGTCACTLKKMVDTHNNAITISELSNQIKSPEKENV